MVATGDRKIITVAAIMVVVIMAAVIMAAVIMAAVTMVVDMIIEPWIVTATQRQVGAAMTTGTIICDSSPTPHSIGGVGKPVLASPSSVFLECGRTGHPASTALTHTVMTPMGVPMVIDI
jgi:hypothetical protein